MKMLHQYIIGFTLFILTILIAILFLENSSLIRLMLGITIGYTLMRGRVGFSGVFNRILVYGSTKLSKSMLILLGLCITSNTIFLSKLTPSYFNLYVNPINLPLLISSFIFGILMTLGFRCSFGLLVFLPNSIPIGLVRIFFFGFGGFFALPLVYNLKSFVNKSWFVTTNYNGVFLPDLFGGGNLGLFISWILSLTFLAFLSFLATKTQTNLKNKRYYIDMSFENTQEKVKNNSIFENKIFSVSTYERLFVTPFSRNFTITIVSFSISFVMLYFQSGWSATFPFAISIGKLLINLGIPIETITNYTFLNKETFTIPYLHHQGFVQNLGLILGSLYYSLTSGTYKHLFKFTIKNFFLSSIGSFVFGFFSILTFGCNVGGMFTPFTNFSLSSWLYIIFCILGCFCTIKTREKLGL